MRLDIGCGPNHVPGTDGLVGLDLVAPADVIADITEGLPFDADTFDEVTAQDVLEHIRSEYQYHVWNEVHRVLKPGGVWALLIPGADLDINLAWRDPTHVFGWVHDSIRYFAGARDDVCGEQAFRSGRTAEWTVAEYAPVDMTGEERPTYYYVKCTKTARGESSRLSVVGSMDEVRAFERGAQEELRRELGAR